MTVEVAVPGRTRLTLDHLILDVNGTLTYRGTLIDGVADRLTRLRERVRIHLLSADTFGTLPALAGHLGVDAERVDTGADKAAAAHRLGAASCAAIGNGANDEQLLRSVALGVAVIGPEGASPRTLAAADIVCVTITDALDLLLDPRTLAATLRP